MRKLVDWCDIVIFQGYIMFENPSIAKSNKVVVADIYDPFHLEQLEQTRDLVQATRRDVVRSATDVLNEQLERGDLFLCASAKQRDFWLGQLAAVGRINPSTYDDGESLERLLQVVPFGVSDDRPLATRKVLRGVVPGIDDDAKIILWGGGVYNWFDPISLLRAVDKLRARMPQVRLYFLGMKHPNPHVPEMRMAVRTRQLADELGLTDTHVFFNEGWVEYEDRQNYLLESDVGVSTHLDHVETEFSFRTRILDYLWAGLPVVATGGDSFAELIDERGVGRTVPAGRRRRARSGVVRGPVRSRRQRPVSCRRRRGGRRVPLVARARAAGRVLPSAASRSRPGTARDGRPGRHRSLAGHPTAAHGPLARGRPHGRRAPPERRARHDESEGAGSGAPSVRPHVVPPEMSDRGPDAGADPSPDQHLDQRCVVVVYVAGDDRRYYSTVADLAASSGRDVVVAASDHDTLAGFGELLVETITAATARDAIDAVWSKRRTHVFAVTDAVLVPGDAIERAERILAADLRHATVSFLSNDAGGLSFPSRRPTPAVPAGFDHQSLTRRLRASTPPSAPCPVPFACGGAVMLSDVALTAVGGLDVAPADVSIDGCLADFSMRCRERGFVDLLDPETFVFRPPTPGRPFSTEPMPADDRAWLVRRHPQLLPAFEQEEATHATPAALANGIARVKTFGVRVLIDDATLGPVETGAQITTLAIIDALAKHDDVQEVGVALSGHMPAYAKLVLGQPKVNVNLRIGGYAAFSGYDVLHRTAQPDKDFDVEVARGAASRVVISILDLIAYRAGSYHASADDWLRYREVLRDAARRADGITTISEDVAATLALEQIPVEPERVFPILYGTEHLSGHEEASFPAELAESGRLAGEFMVCIGTDYAHKNRDLAIAVHEELARRGRNLTLVLAGPSVPYGGSRNSERQRLRNDGDVVFLPALTARERNWLFRHAAVVLYPTSAEGFGLVPFEAARFGSPTVTVGFGPLLETSERLPVVATSWDPRELADCVERLVADPVLRREQVSTTLQAADRYSWRRTAEEFLVMYRALIARPVR